MTLTDYVIVVLPVLVFTFWGLDIWNTAQTRKEFRVMRAAVEAQATSVEVSA